MTTNKILPRFLQVSILLLIFISPGLLFSGISTSNDANEQSIVAESGNPSVPIYVEQSPAFTSPSKQSTLDHALF